MYVPFLYGRSINQTVFFIIAGIILIIEIGVYLL